MVVLFSVHDHRPYGPEQYLRFGNSLNGVAWNLDRQNAERPALRQVLMAALLNQLQGVEHYFYC